MEVIITQTSKIYKIPYNSLDIDSKFSIVLQESKYTFGNLSKHPNSMPPIDKTKYVYGSVLSDQRSKEYIENLGSPNTHEAPLFCFKLKFGENKTLTLKRICTRVSNCGLIFTNKLFDWNNECVKSCSFEFISHEQNYSEHTP